MGEYVENIDFVMNSLFYARYDPATSAGNVDSNTQLGPAKSIKKRKTDTGSVTVITRKQPRTEDQIEKDVHKSVSVRDEYRKKKILKRKEDKENKNENENENISSKPESASTIKEVTAIRKPDGDKTHIGVDKEIVTDEISKPKKSKKKLREDLSIKEHEPSDAFVKRKALPQQEDLWHQNTRAKWEKSALLTREESQVGEHERPDKGQTASSTEVHGLVPIPQPEQRLHNDTKTKGSALPDWLAHPTVARSSDTLSLDNFAIHPTTLGSLQKKGYKDAFAVQATVLPLLMPGPNRYNGDICISAATGSGKTLAYALPLIENLRDRPTKKLRGLVVVPTRELVAQARSYLEVCASGSKLQIGTAVGSKSIQEEQDHLVGQGQRYDPEAYQAELEMENDEIEDLMDWDFESLTGKGNKASHLINYVNEYTSKVDILICTPGRLVDHMRSTKGFTLEHIQWLVIDEADRLLDESFQEWVDIIMPALAFQAPLNPIDQHLEHMFRRFNQRTVRKIVLSATMTKDIGKITALQLRRPKMVLLETHQQSSRTGDAHSAEKLDEGLERDIQLPSTLVEIAMPIANAEEKPLHLIHLLENITGAAKGIDRHSQLSEHRSKSPSIISEEAPEDTDSNFNTTSTSSISSSNSSRPNAPDIDAKRKEPTDGILLFTSNNESALRLARLLTLLRPGWSPIIRTLTKSTTSTSARKAISRFNTNTHQGKGFIIIASDRASRGLDLPGLAHVINYEMPPSVTSYVHRVGRTARAGRDGVATTLVAHHEARWFWNDIARNKGIGRGEGRKVRRVEPKLDIITEEERRLYAEALEVLGREARGETGRTASA